MTSDYRIARRTARMVLEGDYAGAEAVCRLDVGLGFYFGLTKLLTSGDVPQIEEAFQRFGDEALIEWNLKEEDGKALPATGEGMLMLPTPLAQAILRAWTDTVGAVPVPLGQASRNGVTSPAESAAMEASSANPPD